ncbi:MAG TPA: hypothetical protein VEK07_01880 [Polyangiaceae bacterium]|nr:hypothetical protein [Polyangiaceae bacterium]
MTSTVRSLLVFGAGFVSGWAARSLTDSPHDAGVKLMALAMSTKERVGRWAAVERERLADMFAEAHSRLEPQGSHANGAVNGVAQSTDLTGGAA